MVSLTTPHGTTNFPSLLFQGSAGNYSTSREELQVAGADKKLDYLGAFSWMQTANDLPMDKFHVATAAGNLGWRLNGTTQIRGTVHYGVSATGVPNAWDFYHVTDDATEKDQDIFLSAPSITRPQRAFIIRHYGLTRKREQDSLWTPEGICLPVGTAPGPRRLGRRNYFGIPVTIKGANGYSATGQALLDYSQANGEVYAVPIQLSQPRSARLPRRHHHHSAPDGLDRLSI